MNEQFKLKIEREFSIHCVKKQEDGTYLFDKYKFAELIVRECIDTVLDCSIEYTTRPRIAQELKEHFGVE